MKEPRSFAPENVRWPILTFAALLLGIRLSAAVEGTVESIRPVGAGLELDLVSGTNRLSALVQNAASNSPTLFSRLRLEDQIVADWSRVEQLTGQTRPLARNASDLRRLGATGPRVGCVADLSGQVLALGSAAGSLAFKDETGIILLTIGSTVPLITAGQTVHLQGNCVIEGAQVTFRSPPVVDNDNIHRMTERSGSVYLTEGFHALRLGWFNRDYPCGLEVYYQGPGLSRQTIPDNVLFRPQILPSPGGHGWTSGLAYRCFEGRWLRVPDFDELLPAKEGIAANIDPQVATRSEYVALEFKGFIQIARAGLYTFSTSSDDGSLLFVDEQPPSVTVTGRADLPDPSPLLPGQPLAALAAPVWARMEGKVAFASQASGRAELELDSDSGRARVLVLEGLGALTNMIDKKARLTGLCLAALSAEGKTVAATLLVPGLGQIEYWDPSTRSWTNQLAAPEIPIDSGNVPTNLPVLVQVDQVKRLTRQQWQRGYPVRLRGVVTSVLDSGIFIEDPSWSIYARWKSPTNATLPRVGDLWEIEGKTFAEFAPNILIDHAARLGDGVLPVPLHPTWDQLINGRLDTKFIEIQGVVTSVNSDGVTLLTRDGKLGLVLLDLQPQAVPPMADALVRVRGCVIPLRDRADRLLPGRIQLCSVSVTMDEPPPVDPFAAPLKHASDLLLFDWRAGAFQRVKVAGQVLGERLGEYFLADGSRGLRFIPKTHDGLKAGDLAEVVGFLELAGPSPTLREAVVQRVGSTNLPAPAVLPPDALFDRRYDATWVTLQGRLTGVNHDGSGDVLELQSGSHGFVARLKWRDVEISDLAPGALLQLTGIYVGQGGDLASGGGITSFELLVNSSADIKVLSRPPWWTARRALGLLAGMVLALAVGTVWIALLRRQVEERSQQLAAEVRRHEYTDHQRELEAERARIARDLHDDLGAALTQIRFLSALESRDARTPESARGRMQQVSEKSRDMVASLDEIVWAIDPANDSPASLANYLCHFAGEFFRLTPIRCRLDVADALPSAPLTSEVRHHLYLAVREGLNNIAKHSGATEVWLRVAAAQNELRIILEDNGRGFTPDRIASPGHGLVNMTERLDAIGGRFECESKPGSGALCRFVLPLRANVFHNGNGVHP